MAVPARRLERTRPQPRPVRPVRAVPAPSTRRAPRRRGHRVPFLVFALFVTAAMVVALASAQALVAQGSFRKAELARQAELLEQEHGRLRLAAARLSSPERITRAAHRAGLVLPDEVEILAVDGSSDPRPPALPEATFALKDEPGGAG